MQDNQYISGFEGRWRPNYEYHAMIVWIVATILTLVIVYTIAVPRYAGLAISGICLLCAFGRFIQGAKRSMLQARMQESGLLFIGLSEFMSRAQSAVKRGSAWLGFGFPWTDKEARSLYRAIFEGISSLVPTTTHNGHDGAYWIHGLNTESDIYQDLADAKGHTLIVGTTRVGKTRMFELLIGQAIIRHETVIVIDPKGDHDLATNIRQICKSVGREDSFAFFSPAHPDRSVCIDPIKNWNRRTELASRIAALIPSETKADPFTAFSWKVLNDIINGLIASEIKPKLIHLRRYIEGGPDSLVEQALRRYFVTHVDNWESKASSYIRKHRSNTIAGYIEYYRDQVIRDYPSTELDGLISTYEHNREHFQKMIASLIPVLSMLTSHPLDILLSPDERMGTSKQVVDMSRVCRDNMVLYVGLDSLSDFMIGSAIGSILLADLTAVAGDRYNYSGSNQVVNIFIDEAAEVINDPTIQLMNKGAGALIRVYLATQTLADFEARLGSDAKARQVLGNANNRIIFRVMDGETQKYLSEGMPTVLYQRLDVKYGHSIDADINSTRASYTESATEKEAELFPKALLGELPPLHYIARLAGGRTIKGRIPILRTSEEH